MRNSTIFFFLKNISDPKHWNTVPEHVQLLWSKLCLLCHLWTSCVCFQYKWERTFLGSLYVSSHLTLADYRGKCSIWHSGTCLNCRFQNHWLTACLGKKSFLKWRWSSCSVLLVWQCVNPMEPVSLCVEKEMCLKIVVVLCVLTCFDVACETHITVFSQLKIFS